VHEAAAVMRRAAQAMVAAAALAAACGGGGGATRRPAERPRALTPIEIARRASPSVVTITTDRDLLGTGFVIAKGGLIASNLHVVKGARRVKVTSSDQKWFDEVTVVGFDARRDLVVLRVPELGHLRPLQLDTGDPVVGQHVVAIGNPRGLERTVSDGLVSSLRHFGVAYDVIQISAPIGHGSSGGPVFNDRGRVIGVATSGLGDANLNFATPVGYLAPLLEEGGSAALTTLPDDSARRYFRGCSSADLVTTHAALAHALAAGAPLSRKRRHREALEHYRLAAADLILRVPRCGGPRYTLLVATARAERQPSDEKAADVMRQSMTSIARWMASALR